MNNNGFRSWGGIAVSILLAILLVRCTGTPTATPTATPRDDSAIRIAFMESSHADTYDVGMGPNTYCAVCKSPTNWDPAAVIDAPPNCVSCKFPGDAEIRIAAGNLLISEMDWHGIWCDTCHIVNDDGEISAEIGWLAADTGTYTPMSTSTALCEQCHRDTEAGTLRRREMGESPAHPDATCTTCHDAHSLNASCETCHNPTDTSTAFVAACWQPYLAPDALDRHSDVRCEACHDHGGLDSGPVDDINEPFAGYWTTWRSTTVAGVIPVTSIWVSHNLSSDVDCARCHYPDNPWSLSDEVN